MSEVIQMGSEGIPFVRPIPKNHHAYTTSSSRSNWGTLVHPDLPQRLHFSTEGTRGAYGWRTYIPPNIIYEETRKTLLKKGTHPEQAHQFAMERAETAAQEFSDDPHIGPKAFSSLQRLKMNNVNPYQGMDMPVGASRGENVRRGPRNTKVTGTGHNPNSQRDPMMMQNPVSPGSEQLETYSFTSVDGNFYEFPKKIGKKPVRGFYPSLIMVALAEMAKGGNPFLPLAAAGIKLADMHENVFFEFPSLLADAQGADGDEFDDDPPGLSME